MTLSNALFPTARTIRIATRASKLALWQAHHVANKIHELQPGLCVEILHISTEGDRDTSAPLWQMGGLGVFTREVQKAVLEDQADLAVHSLKDLPTTSTAGLCLAAVPQRADHFDVLVMPSSSKPQPQNSDPFENIPWGATIGTGSLRRRAQILHFRPDLHFIEVRGNVDTRLRKLDAGECQALILAAAGLTRLELAHRISLKLTPPWMYPAVGQGALGIECRETDEELRCLLNRLNHAPTRTSVTAERGLLHGLRAGCHAPVGANTTINQSTLSLEAVILNPQGTSLIKARCQGDMNTPEQLAQELTQTLTSLGSESLLS